MFSYERMIYNVKSEWMSFILDNKDELDNIINELNSYKYTIYPYCDNIFKALTYFQPNETKLVILGQDPYINSENDVPQACGLSFSVPSTHKIPPSLLNIFKEIQNNYSNYEIPKNGCLERWCNDSKILLLNSSLTVESGKSNSHAKLWNNFTNKLISYISHVNESTIFLLMGNFAQSKEKYIDEDKHKIFKTIHPSPLSAYKGFFGCDVFLSINEYCKEKNIDEIKW